MTRRPPALGRGLSALLGDVARDVPVAGGEGGGGRTVQNIDIAAIRPHPDQPRRQFNEPALAELAESIAARGVIQPIIVRPVDGGYQIVAGERRWRAAQRAQLHRIPAIVRDFDEAETLEIALVENIQREDLNPIEEAQAFRRLIVQFGHRQDVLGRLVGKSRSHVANLMRLLDLPESVQAMVVEGAISMGHARALIGRPDAEALAREVAAKGLSVRQTEQLARPDRERRRRPATPRPADADIAALEQHLGDMLGLRVDIAHQEGKGTLTLRYSTLDQLDMLCLKLTGGRI
jgi:ParB family chromosome partitioning protein